MSARRPIARVLFDEAHGEAWTIRPERARAIQPSHPQDSSYALAAEALIHAAPWRLEELCTAAAPSRRPEADAYRPAQKPSAVVRA